MAVLRISMQTRFVSDPLFTPNQSRFTTSSSCNGSTTWSLAVSAQMHKQLHLLWAQQCFQVRLPPFKLVMAAFEILGAFDFKRRCAKMVSVWHQHTARAIPKHRIRLLSYRSRGYFDVIHRDACRISSKGKHRFLFIYLFFWRGGLQKSTC